MSDAGSDGVLEGASETLGDAVSSSGCSISVPLDAPGATRASFMSEGNETPSTDGLGLHRLHLAHQQRVGAGACVLGLFRVRIRAVLVVVVDGGPPAPLVG